MNRAPTLCASWAPWNVLDPQKQQVVALGRLGWSLRRIEQGDRRAPRDHQRLSPDRRCRRAGPRASAGRRGGGAQRGDGKGGHFADGGVHRPQAVAGAECECLCAVSLPDHRGDRSGAERPRDLAGRGRRTRDAGHDEPAAADLVDDHGFAAGYATYGASWVGCAAPRRPRRAW